MCTKRRAEHRIATFIAKQQIDGEQDWSAPWISFEAIAQYCAKLQTPLKATAGEAGLKFAYVQLAEAVIRGEFDVRGQCRVLLLISHGGKILSVNSSELEEAREAFDPEIFISGYLDRCWARAGLVHQWLLQKRIPLPWQLNTKRILHIAHGRPYGSATHAKDVDIIDKALEFRATRKDVSIRQAVTTAIAESGSTKNNSWGSETDRLRTKMRKRQKLRQTNKNT